MAQVDLHERQLTLKLVYFGPPRSGKTTNLRSLHARVDALNRGRLMTLDTRDDRTLFFDLLPIFFRTSALSFRIKVYTVPGQPMHEATRKVVLQGADGVVFVADSDPSQAAANREAWTSMIRNRAELGLAATPIVLQYNKRDLATGELDAVDRFDDPARPVIAATASRGLGVLATFLAAVGAIWDALEASDGIATRFAVDRAAFLRSVVAHVGGDERDILPR
ncbi:MAG TPA: GTPase domain-containing protein [Kofleriaceae bacterium]|nr:GTPase domain-containing protein [Kofleriaceae bacterium]